MSVLLHVGYHKTGSTWLQREVFPNVRSVEYVGEDDALMAALLRSIAGSGRSPFLPSSFAEVIAEREQRARRSIMLSFEGLSGSAFGHGFDGVAIADRVHEVVPDARLLVVVRRQQEMLPSLYRQYVQQGGVAAYERFVDSDELAGCRFDPTYLEFDGLVRHYEALFPERVWTVPYELLRHEPQAFIDALCGWGELPELAVHASGVMRNQSLSWPLVGVLRTWNRVFRRSAFNPRPLLGAVRWTPRAVLQRRADPIVRRFAPDVGESDRHQLPATLVDRYTPSNRRLEKLIGRDLGPLGYVV